MNPIRPFRLALALSVAAGLLWLLVQPMTARTGTDHATAIHADTIPVSTALDTNAGYASMASLTSYEAACIAGVGDVADLINDINAANTNPGVDTVVLGAGCTYTFTAANNYWYGPNALPPIASTVVISGNGATLVNANPTRLRFFYVGADPTSTRTPGYHTPGAGDLTLHNLTLAGGITRGGNGSGGGAGMGGAIFNQGTLFLERVTLSHNAAIGGSAGAYWGGGGGMGEDGNSYGGGGFGGAVTPVGSSGAATSGGGGGFRPTDNASGVAGGGSPDGLGGRAYGSPYQGSGGNGSGGGIGLNDGTSAGGNFGFGGSGFSSQNGSGGGVGGGGEKSTSYGGGGGGFGGGGGGGYGGFGGGGGEGFYIEGGNSGFGGGPTLGGTGHGGGGAGMGGAIFNHGGSLTITNSTLTGNTARGGGSYQGDAMSLGGAIFNLNGSVMLLNSTLAGNTVVAGDSGGLGGGAAAGGALYNLRYTLDATIPDATVVLQNSILADSIGGVDLFNYRPANLVAASGGGANTGAASVTFATLNLIESRANSGGVFADTVTPLVGMDPQLGALGDYGGGAATLPLRVPDSPALNVGDNAVCPPTDQRGEIRPMNGICDLGAYEAPPYPILSLTKTVTPTRHVSYPGLVTYTLVLRNSGNAAASPAILTDTLPTALNFGQWITAPSSGLLQQGNAFTWTGVLTAHTALTYSFQAENLLEAGNVTNEAVLSDASQRRTASATFEVRVLVTNGNDAGPGSLRQAIADTDAGETIRFSGDTSIYLDSELYINKSLTIDGGDHAITISGDSGNDGSRNTRVFSIAASGGVTLSHVTIVNGTAGDGGCIYNNAGSRLTLQNSMVSNCTASDYGGGIYNAVYMPQGATLFLQNSALLNSVAQYGGGFYNAYDSVATLQNSTMSGNSASQLGAGFYNVGTLTLQNSTLSGNGMVYNYGTLHYQNTIIANGSCWSTGSIGANVNNLVENSSGCGQPALTATPRLGPLANNGGDTLTFAPLPASPVIDAGDAAYCLLADQRGEPRTDLRCDIGAFELQYGDSDTVVRLVAADALTTFGPTLVGMQRDGAFTDPGVITVTKVTSWASQGLESIGAWWEITPTVTEGFSLTLQLCYTAAELGTLDETTLRFWRLRDGSWAQVGGSPTLVTVNGHRCARMSGVDRLSVWTLATAEPTAVSLSSFSTTSPAGWVGWWVGLMVVGGMGTAVAYSISRHFSWSSPFPMDKDNSHIATAGTRRRNRRSA